MQMIAAVILLYTQHPETRQNIANFCFSLIVVCQLEFAPICDSAQTYFTHQESIPPLDLNMRNIELKIANIRIN